MESLPKFFIVLIVALVTNAIALPSPDAGGVDFARRNPGQYRPLLFECCD